MSFFFNDTATTEIYTLSLHDALPICRNELKPSIRVGDEELIEDAESAITPGDVVVSSCPDLEPTTSQFGDRSEEHTSELQSRQYLVCRLLLEKKKKYSHNSSNFRSPN